MSSPIRGQAFTFTLELQDANSNQPRLNPPLVVGDVKVIKDSGAAVNIETLPVLNSSDATEVIVTLSATEMDAERVTVKFSQVAGNDWLWESVRIFTVAHEPARQTTLLETKAKTDLLPAQPAAAGDEMNLVDGGITAAKIATNALTASKFGTGAITLRVVADEVIDSIAEAVDAELAAELSSIYELVDTRLAAADYTVPANASIELLVQFQKADRYYDTSDAEAYMHVVEFAGVELDRKQLLDIDGQPIRSIHTPIARLGE